MGTHRAPVPFSEATRRMVPPLAAVSAVVIVIVLLLVLNRPSQHGSTPALQSPAVVTSSSASAAASTSPTPAPSPSEHRVRHPAPVAEPSATQAPRVAKVPVTVLNNSRVYHLAARVAAQLRGGGWPVRDVGNFTGRVAASTAYYPPGGEAAARALARQFPAVQRVLPRFHGLPGRGLTLVVTRYWPH